MVRLSMVDFKIVANPVCFGNISKEFSVANMKKKTGLYRYVYDFIFDYRTISVDDILDIYILSF